MSTSSGTPNVFRKINKEEQDIQDHEVPQSAILYLLQEATKLASPAKQDCLEYRDLCGILSGEKNEWHKQYSSSSRYASTSHLNNHGEHDSEPQQNYTGSFSILHTQSSSSPWEVMSLINLQCERLLCPGNGKDVEMNAVATAPAFDDTGFCFRESKSTGHTRGLSGFIKGSSSCDVPHHGKKAMGDIEALRPSSRGDEAMFAEEAGGNSDVIVSAQNSKNMLEDTPVPSQNPPQTNGDDRSVNSYGRDKKEIDLVQLADTETGDTPYLRNISCESKESGDGLLGGDILRLSSSEGKEKCLSSDYCAPRLLVPLLHQDSQQLECNATTKTEKTVSSSIEWHIPLPMADCIPDQDVKADCNSNVIQSLDSSKDVQPQCCPQALSNKSDGNRETGNPKPVPNEGTSDLHCEPHGDCAGNKGDQQPKLAHAASDIRWRVRTPRKQSHPTRSADLCDPDFQGVTFRMHTELNESKDQCRLLITANYSAELLKGGRRVRGSRPRPFMSCLKSSSSEEESDSSGLSNAIQMHAASIHFSPTNYRVHHSKVGTNWRIENKMCASCNTKKTPLWRDAEDGTPLCNACGIRYKKYRVRCFQCWHIPRKEGNSNSKCYKCGDVLRLAASHRKLTSW